MLRGKSQERAESKSKPRDLAEAIRRIAHRRPIPLSLAEALPEALRALIPEILARMRLAKTGKAPQTPAERLVALKEAALGLKQDLEGWEPPKPSGPKGGARPSDGDGASDPSGGGPGLPSQESALPSGKPARPGGRPARPGGRPGRPGEGPGPPGGRPADKPEKRRPLGMDDAAYRFLRGWAAREGMGPREGANYRLLSGRVLDGCAGFFREGDWPSSMPELLGALEAFVRSLALTRVPAGDPGQSPGGRLEAAMVGALDALGGYPSRLDAPPASKVRGTVLRILKPGARRAGPLPAEGARPGGGAQGEGRAIADPAPGIMALALYGAPAVALDCLAGFYSAGPLARHYLGIIDATRRFLAERGAAALLWRLGPGRRFGKGPMTLRNLCGALGGSPSRVGGWRREILGSLSAILGEARAAFLEGFRDLEESLPLGMLYFRLQRDKMVGSVSGKYSPLGLWDGSRRRRLWPLGSAGPPLGPGPAPGPGALAGGVPRPGLRDSLRDILDLLRHVPPGRG